MFKKTLSLFVIICFFLTSLGPLPKAHADADLALPAPGTMMDLSPAYQPAIIRGLTVHKDNPFLFDFIVDVGQDRMSGEPLKKEGEKLIKYFLASLAIPDKDVWVNLSPYEKDRIIPDALGQTDMGRDLLEQDYVLKQITASLIYPEKQLGKVFWNRVYAEAQEKFGTTQIPVDTFNKVWIMADRAEVFEHNQTAFVVDSHLKVMLEEDYLSLQKHSESSGTHSITSQIVKQIVLPELEKEINTGKNFANLRQIFNSIILASWYKKNLKEALLNQVYSDKSKINGVTANQAKEVQAEIYDQYLKAYKKGVFNYIKDDINASNGQMLPRKYFSGGITPAMAAHPITDNGRSSRGQGFLRSMALKITALVIMGTMMSQPQAVQASPLSVPSVLPAVSTSIYSDAAMAKTAVNKDEVQIIPGGTLSKPIPIFYRDQPDLPVGKTILLILGQKTLEVKFKRSGKNTFTIETDKMKTPLRLGDNIKDLLTVDFDNGILSPAKGFGKLPRGSVHLDLTVKRETARHGSHGRAYIDMLPRNLTTEGLTIFLTPPATKTVAEAPINDPFVIREKLAKDGWSILAREDDTYTARIPTKDAPEFVHSEVDRQKIVISQRIERVIGFKNTVISIKFLKPTQSYQIVFTINPAMTAYEDEIDRLTTTTKLSLTLPRKMVIANFEHTLAALWALRYRIVENRQIEGREELLKHWETKFREFTKVNSKAIFSSVENLQELGEVGPELLRIVLNAGINHPSRTDVQASIRGAAASDIVGNARGERETELLKADGGNVGSFVAEISRLARTTKISLTFPIDTLKADFKDKLSALRSVRYRIAANSINFKNHQKSLLDLWRQQFLAYTKAQTEAIFDAIKDFKDLQSVELELQAIVMDQEKVFPPDSIEFGKVTQEAERIVREASGKRHREIEIAEAEAAMITVGTGASSQSDLFIKKVGGRFRKLPAGVDIKRENEITSMTKRRLDVLYKFSAYEDRGRNYIEIQMIDLKKPESSRNVIVQTVMSKDEIKGLAQFLTNSTDWDHIKDGYDLPYLVMKNAVWGDEMRSLEALAITSGLSVKYSLTLSAAKEVYENTMNRQFEDIRIGDLGEMLGDRSLAKSILDEARKAMPLIIGAKTEEVLLNASQNPVIADKEWLLLPEGDSQAYQHEAIQYLNNMIWFKQNDLSVYNWNTTTMVRYNGYGNAVKKLTELAQRLGDSLRFVQSGGEIFKNSNAAVTPAMTVDQWLAVLPPEKIGVVGQILKATARFTVDERFKAALQRLRDNPNEGDRVVAAHFIVAEIADLQGLFLTDAAIDNIANITYASTIQNSNLSIGIRYDLDKRSFVIHLSDLHSSTVEDISVGNDRRKAQVIFEYGTQHLGMDFQQLAAQLIDLAATQAMTAEQISAIERLSKFFRQHNKNDLVFGEKSLPMDERFLLAGPLDANMNFILDNEMVRTIIGGRGVSIERYSDEGNHVLALGEEGINYYAFGFGKHDVWDGSFLDIAADLNRMAAEERAVSGLPQGNDTAMAPGGIDLNTSSGMQLKDSKDGHGVEMTIDPAMIARFRREGLSDLTPVIFSITPVASIWPLAGLQAPLQAEPLVGA